MTLMDDTREPAGVRGGGDFDRTPPQAIEAEQSVLGAMMLSKDAIADVVEVIRPGDFYRPAHQQIYDAVLDLYARGEPADAVTVSAELTRAGQLARVGGAPYLHTLIAMVPTAANAGYYAEIVADRATLRRLVVAGTRIVQMGYDAASGSSDAVGDVDDIVDRAQVEIYDVSERRLTEDYVQIESLLQTTLDEIEKISAHGGVGTGIPTGFQQLDEITNGLHAGQMITLAGRPGSGKSTLALDFARSAAIKNQKSTAIFSLEMGRLEIMMRLFSAEAGVALQNMRSGHMSDQDWRRLALRSSELAGAPLFIDDSPNMTMMEIRAKARRLKQRNDLQLIVIDYLQLMTSGKRVESRQQEVSEFSRAMKLLAKELEVPVVALSQLNRSPEQRSDKKPMLSDLRESGCLPTSTRVWRADTGAETSIGELYHAGERDITVWALDRRLRMVPRRMTHVFSTGTKPVFRLRLQSGRTVDATANHPMYTYDGWRPLGELAPGDRVAIARTCPEPLQPVREPDERRIILLAHRLASLGVVDKRTHEKFVPQAVFALPDDQLALFLRHLWAAGGCMDVDRNNAVRISYASTSRRLADDVTRLLTRFGITACIGAVHRAGYRDCFQVQVIGYEPQRSFLSAIGCHGALGEVATRAAEVLAGVASNTDLDTVPRQVWERVRRVLHEQQVTHPELAAAMSTSSCGSTLRGSTLRKDAPSRARLARVADVLDDADLEMLATNDVYWDTVVDVEPLGDQQVFDATVPGEHNFLADGVMVHNSIEQDSDMVLLVHRPDLYEPETERAGEADLIIAKHRNGPTATVAVAFQGRYSRFADMPS